MQLRWKPLAAAAAIALGAALVPAQAVSYVYAGDTTGAPVWQRPVAGLGGLSGVGTAVAYQVLQFSVDADGSYDFLSTANGWDNFLFLYSGSFNPATPLANGVIGNDDFPSIGLSGFNGVALTAGTSYYLVTTGFGNGDFGAFENSINGPGNVSAVPEPQTYALMALGLAGVGLFARRRSLR